MNNHKFDLQPDNLKDNIVRLEPIHPNDFERLYLIASDPLIWVQHPDKERFRRDRFQIYFDSAIESKGAFLVFDIESGELIGSTRYYEYSPEDSSIAIGFTFLSRNFWGGLYNRSMKKLLIDYAFQYVSSVYFHIGITNIRSQKAIEKLGAVKMDMTDFEINSANISHFEYQIQKQDWMKK